MPSRQFARHYRRIHGTLPEAEKPKPFSWSWSALIPAEDPRMKAWRSEHPVLVYVLMPILALFLLGWIVFVFAVLMAVGNA